ncbi:MAG: hypothetical protein ACYCW6_17115, partial [Candidatus Xenobia bacterium]
MTVLFYGSREHQVLQRLYRYVEERGRRRAVFFPLESFPTRTRLVLEPGGGRLDLDGEAIPLHEIVSA